LSENLGKLPKHKSIIHGGESPLNMIFPHYLVKNWGSIWRKPGEAVPKKATAFEVLKKSKDLQDLLQTFRAKANRWKMKDHLV